MTTKVTLGGKLLFPTEYLSAVEFQGKDVTLTIKSVGYEDLRMRDGSTEKKPVLHFSETPKRLVLNKTNADSIAHVYGSRAEAWAGKRVTLYPTRAKFGRETVDAIRVREIAGGAKPAPGPAPAPAKSIGDADAQPPDDFQGDSTPPTNP